MQTLQELLTEYENRYYSLSLGFEQLDYLTREKYYIEFCNRIAKLQALIELYKILLRRIDYE